MASLSEYQGYIWDLSSIGPAPKLYPSHFQLSEQCQPILEWRYPRLRATPHSLFAAVHQVICKDTTTKHRYSKARWLTTHWTRLGTCVLSWLHEGLSIRRRLVIYLVNVEKELDFLSLYVPLVFPWHIANEARMIDPETSHFQIRISRVSFSTARESVAQPCNINYTTPVPRLVPWRSRYRMRDHYGERIVIVVATIQPPTRGWVHDPNWYDVTLVSITRDIPFAITYYREINLWLPRSSFWRRNW